MRNFFLIFFVLGGCFVSAKPDIAIAKHNTETLVVQDTLFVIDFLLCRDVVEREPVDIVQSYTMDDGRAWAFARLHNSEGMMDVTFRWFYEDNEYFIMDSKIGESPNWRTYSSVTLQPGVWRVEILDESENILREIRFYVSE